MKKNIQISLIIELLSRAIADLTDEDLEKVALGTHSIDLKIVRSRAAIKSKGESKQFNSAEIVKKLEEFSDRVVASNYLKEIATNKKSLELIARHLDIALSKQDKLEDLVNKIIESTVGARLRSSAIRGHEV